MKACVLLTSHDTFVPIRGWSSKHLVFWPRCLTLQPFKDHQSRRLPSSGLDRKTQSCWVQLHTDKYSSKNIHMKLVLFQCLQLHCFWEICKSFIKPMLIFTDGCCRKYSRSLLFPSIYSFFKFKFIFSSTNKQKTIAVIKWWQMLGLWLKKGVDWSLA